MIVFHSANTATLSSNHSITHISPHPAIRGLHNPMTGGVSFLVESEIDYELAFNFKFSPFDAPSKVYEKMQNDFYRVFNHNRLRTLEGIAKFLDVVETKMDNIDSERQRQESAKILFPSRIREMWISAFIH